MSTELGPVSTANSVREAISEPARSSRSTGAARIWTVGGGKGGTGKSLIAANLGVLLAEKALNTNLIDADLGAPNLHTFLGIENPRPNLGDFLYQKGVRLSQFALPTFEPNLRLVPGPHRTLFADNLQYFRKRKLQNHIRRLEGTITLVDIGAGTTFNTLDFFLLSDLGIVVVTPDPASIENAYHFLRSAAYRTLEAVGRKLGIEEVLSKIIGARHRGPISIPQLLEEVSRFDSGAGNILTGALHQRRNVLILNKTGDGSAASIGLSICDVARKVLGIPLRYLGAVPWDEQIASSLRQLNSHVRLFPESRSAKALWSIADSLVEDEFKDEK